MRTATLHQGTLESKTKTKTKQPRYILYIYIYKLLTSIGDFKMVHIETCAMDCAGVNGYHFIGRAPFVQFTSVQNGGLVLVFVPTTNMSFMSHRNCAGQRYIP